VVLRSSKALGRQSLLRPVHSRLIQKRLEETAGRWGVKVHRFANVGNHLHLLIRARSRSAWQGFIREFSGSVAMLVTGARKGHALGEKRFWDHLVFTRLVAFGRDFDGVMNYLVKNLFEAQGIPMKKLLSRGARIISLRGVPPPRDIQAS
jgi:REP element-mobilizing transposase RayT